MTRTSVSVLLATLLASTAARADRLPLRVVQAPATPEFIEKHKDDAVKALSGVVIYLNRCVGGCMVHPGQDDPSTDTSIIVNAPTLLAEHAWKTGEWEAMVQCVKDVYSPYNVKVTDVRPVGQQYNEVIVAGGYNALGQQASCGLASAIGGIGCTPLLGVVAFAFVEDGCYQQQANGDPDLMGAGSWGMCAVAAQETAHDLGLDHAFGKFDSGQSTCNDPMTYQYDCGGEKFFRNDFAPCNGNDGKVKAGCGGADECGAKQNSHEKLLAAVGPGTPTTTPPAVANQVPANGAVVKAGTPVIVKAKAQRGVARVELWINGYRWGDPVKGVAFGSLGQPEAAYTLTIPAGLPDSKLDIVVKAFDDIDIEGEGATITAVKGKAAGCDPTVMNADGTIDTCLKGQQCNAGKCAWTDAGMGQFGDACTYPQFCEMGTCDGTATQQICTHSCSVSITDSCPMGYSCTSTGAGDSGICFPTQPSAGCCSVGDEGMPAVAAHGGIARLTLGALFGRRRKRAA